MKFNQALAAALLAGTQVDANRDVMKVIKDSITKLMDEGFTEVEGLHSSLKGSPQSCSRGKVVIAGEVFSCDEVDFLSFMGWEELEIFVAEHRDGVGRRAADIWGWLSPTGREFTLQSMDNGVVAIDTTDPLQPCVVAKMPLGGRPADVWADVKVHADTMYHVKDTSYYFELGFAVEPNATNTYGIEVYDLKVLDQLKCNIEDYVVPNLYPNYVSEDHGRSHNLVVNTDSEMLYSVGTDSCDGGFMAFDLSEDRLRPKQVACVGDDGYTHDAQCLTYDGPDERFTNHEICFAFNEDTVTIWDFTDIRNGNFELISRTFYPNQAYTHQGWVNNDLTKVLMDDELDELCNINPLASRRCALSATGLTGANTTGTYAFDITDLRAPFFDGVFDHQTDGIDHNLYVWGEVHRQGWGGNAPMKYHPDPNFAYMNNYFSGLRIVDIKSRFVNRWQAAGHFDISPEREEIAFGGAWSGYMHPSGVYAISSIERGLFLLSPRMAFTEDFPKEDANGGDDNGDDSDNSDDKSLLLIVIALLILASACGTANFMAGRKKNKKRVDIVTGDVKASDI